MCCNNDNDNENVNITFVINVVNTVHFVNEYIHIT